MISSSSAVFSTVASSTRRRPWYVFIAWSAKPAFSNWVRIVYGGGTTNGAISEHRSTARAAASRIRSRAFRGERHTVAAGEPWLSVTARVSEAALRELERSTALRLEPVPGVLGPRDGLRPHGVRVRFATIEEARAHLLAFGGSVEVLDPLALRLSLADFASQTLRVYDE